MARFIDKIWRKASLSVRLIVVNVAVFVALHLLGLVAVLGGGSWADGIASHWLGMPASPEQLLVRPWTLLTYMFTQVEVLHLLFNMLWLYWFGDLFLTLGTNRQLMVLYIYGGVLGAVLYLAALNLMPHFGNPAAAVLVGSSASVIAIVVATAWRMPDFSVSLFLFGSVRLKWIAIVTVGLSLLSISGENPGGNIAHIGGAVAGMVFGLAITHGVDITALFRRRHRKPKASVTDDDPNLTLDALLDKVRRSGYNSLNAAERRRLLDISKRL